MNSREVKRMIKMRAMTEGTRGEGPYIKNYSKIEILYSWTVRGKYIDQHNYIFRYSLGTFIQTETFSGPFSAKAEYHTNLCYFKIKPEYLDQWGPEATEDTIVGWDTIEMVSRQWEKPIYEVLDQLDLV